MFYGKCQLFADHPPEHGVIIFAVPRLYVKQFGKALLKQTKQPRAKYGPGGQSAQPRDNGGKLGADRAEHNGKNIIHPGKHLLSYQS